MKCDEIRERLSLFIDGVLSGADAKAFEEHIASCAECRRLLEETRQAVSSVKSAGPVPLPADFMVRLNERLDREMERKGGKKSIFAVFPWPTMAAVLSLLIVVFAAKETMRPPAQIMKESSPAAVAGTEKAKAEIIQEPALQAGGPVPGGTESPVRVTAKKNARALPAAPAAPVMERKQDAAILSPRVNEEESPFLTNEAPRERAASSFVEEPAARKEAVPSKAAQAYDITQLMRKSVTGGLVAAPQGRTRSRQDMDLSGADEGARSPGIAVIDQWQGSSSGITDPLQTVEVSVEGWRSLWRRHAGPPAPEIDFSRYMAIALFMGEKNSGGYAVTITRIEQSSDRITVWYRETLPSPDAMAAAAMTQPYHIVIIGRQYVPVRFSKD